MTKFIFVSPIGKGEPAHIIHVPEENVKRAISEYRVGARTLGLTMVVRDKNDKLVDTFLPFGC